MKRLLPALLLLSACDWNRAEGPVAVSVIEGSTTIVDPNRTPPDPAQRVMLGAVAQGLVGFDEVGQIRPALAQRWIVTDDGLSAIFRIGRQTGPDGKPITAEAVARRLRGAISRRGRNPLRDAIDSIDEIAVMTPEVIELRLKTARPPLLGFLAQPELAMVWNGAGSGPFQIRPREGNSATLLLKPDPLEEPAPEAARTVRVRGERAALAIARFQDGKADLVLGGTYRDWPIVQTAGIARRAIRFDPAEGLFGLSVVRAQGFLANPENRRALAMAIDRNALIGAFAVERWTPAIQVLPARYRSGAEPVVPGWEGLSYEDRQASARARVAAWEAFDEGVARVRLWLPDGPGSTLLFAQLASDWRRIGVTAERSDFATADLRLVDAVAPAGSAIWYLSTLACPAPPGACSIEARDALDLAREATTLAERGQHLAAADQALADSGLYIPIARPLRWSLVAPRLTLFRENARAVHPLDRLRRLPR
jgi:peptide/nickel transport system substrate-binding protein